MASECYSCGNRLDSRVNGETVLILCRDECNYQTMRARDLKTLSGAKSS